MSKEFTIVGGTKTNGEKWSAEVTMETPSGEKSSIESGFIFLDEEAAKAALQQTVNDLVFEARKLGGIVASYEEGAVQ